MRCDPAPEIGDYLVGDNEAVDLHVLLLSILVCNKTFSGGKWLSGLRDWGRGRCGWRRSCGRYCGSEVWLGALPLLGPLAGRHGGRVVSHAEDPGDGGVAQAGSV